MSCGGRKKHWKCGKPKTVNLHKVGSMVRDFGDPCLAQSPIKVVLAVRITFFITFLGIFYQVLLIMECQSKDEM